MKRIQINTIIGKLLIATAFVLLFLGSKPILGIESYVIIGILSILGWFAIGSEYEKYPTVFQIIGFFLASIALGLSLDKPSSHLPYFTLSISFATFMSVSRHVLKRFISELEHRWIEPVALSLSILFYGLGNISGEFSLFKILLPLPIIGFAIMRIFSSNLINNIQIGFAKKGMGIESGKQAPAFSLADQEGNMVNLVDYKDKRNVLLIFVRGDWCPSCHMMLRTYQKQSQKFLDKNIMLFAIGPDPIGVNKEMASKLGVEFKVLSDEGQKTAMAYSVQLPTKYVGEKFDPGIPLPASFLIDKNGIVRYCSRPDKIGEFLDPSSIVPVLASLN